MRTRAVGADIDAVGDRPAAEPPVAAPPAKLQSLRACTAFFFGKATPRILVPLIVVLAAWRIMLGNWEWHDLIVAAAIIGFEPMSEWLIHVHVLHFAPRTVAGRRIDLHAARKHRAHHRNPNDPNTSFVPLVDLAVGAAMGAGLGLVLWWAIDDSGGQILTGFVVGFTILLVYEWTHFLIHTSYRPRHWYYRYVWRAHRLHHFRNEHYWMGVTVHLADHLLGTFPAKSDVPASPTARTLGQEA